MLYRRDNTVDRVPEKRTEEVGNGTIQGTMAENILKQKFRK